VPLVTGIGAEVLWPLSVDRRMLSGEMLIHDFVQVARDYDQIRALVLADPRGLIAAPAGSAYRYGERLSVRLTPMRAHPHVGRSIAIDLAQPYEREDQLVVPMHWWAAGATRLFPHLDGDLEFAPLGSMSTQITLMGSYDPPLGFVGRRADVMLLHRVAEASIRSFLTRLARTLERPARTAAVAGASPAA
jgi:hypothetical protein